MNTHETTLIADLKEEVVDKCRQLSEAHTGDATAASEVVKLVAGLKSAELRVRQAFNNSPSTVYADGLTLKEAATVLYEGKTIAVEVLSGRRTLVCPGSESAEYSKSGTAEDADVALGEPMKDGTTQCVPSFRFWHRESCVLDGPVEILCHQDMLLDDLREVLAAEYGAKDPSALQIAKPYGAWPGWKDPLAIRKDVDWGRKVTPDYRGNVKVATVAGPPFYLKDGDIMFVQDGAVADKELTAAEEAELKKLASAQASSSSTSSYRRREVALKIQQKD
jgi:hypothetical protein